MPPTRRPPPLTLPGPSTALSRQWWESRSPIGIPTPISPTPSGLAKAPVPSPMSPAPSSVQFLGATSPNTSLESFETVELGDKPRPLSPTGWEQVTVENVTQLRSSDALRGKTLLTLTSWWSPEDLAPVKAYLQNCGAKLKVLRRPRSDIQAQYALLPEHMEIAPMAMMHLEGVTPKWVFSCSQLHGLPRVIHGKLQSLHINEVRAPVQPIPRPMVHFPMYKSNNVPFSAWTRPDIMDEVVTCLHEYAYDLHIRLGFAYSDILNVASQGGFCNWWVSHYPQRPSIKAFLGRHTELLEARCEWLKTKNTREKERDAAMLKRLVAAANLYWKAPTGSVSGFWKYWDSNNTDAPAFALRGRFDKQLAEIVPDFVVRRYAIHPYRKPSRSHSGIKDLLEEVVEAMTEFFVVDEYGPRRSQTKHAFLAWWCLKYPDRPHIARFCNDNEDILLERVEGYRKRWRRVLVKPKSMTSASLPKSVEIIDYESEEDENSNEVDVSVEDLQLSPSPSASPSEALSPTGSALDWGSPPGGWVENGGAAGVKQSVHCSFTSIGESSNM